MDIAKIGFAADTKELKDAKATLDALAPSAERAASAADKVGRAAAGIGGQANSAASGIKAVSAAAAGAVTNTERLARAAVGAGSSLNRLGAAANDNINRLQSTPGNIAAQFQDIGVTAAAGMSPMLIALQQGTQLSSAMAGGIGNLMRGFAQLLSLTTLLTIGLVGAVAAGLQMVDWMALAQGLLNGLATGFDMLAGVVEQFAVVIAYAGGVALIAFGPAIYTAVLNLAAAILGKLVYALGYATAAMIAFAAANPFSAVLIAIGLVIGALVLLDKAFGGTFSSILSGVKTAVNFIIGIFVGAFEAVKATWDMLPDALGDAAVRAADRVRRELNDLVKIKNTETGEVSSLFNIKANPNGNPYAGKLAAAGGVAMAAFGKAQGQDYVKGIGEGIASGASWVAGKLRSWADGLGVDPDKKKDKTAKEASGKTIAEKYAELTKSIEAQITALRVESTALDMTANAAAYYRNEQKLLADAMAKGIPITEAVATALGGLAKKLTDAELDVAFKKIRNSAEDNLIALKDQGDLLGLTGYQLSYAKARQELVNQAVKAGTLDLNNMNDVMRERLMLLESIAADTALQDTANKQKAAILEMQAVWENNRIEAAIKRQREQLEFYRETFTGFFSTMMDGLKQGQSVWEAFGNAVMSVVGRIIDRLLEMGTNSLFDMLPKLLGIAMPQARLVGSVNQTIADNPALFAKGGAFTNGVYSEPTLFKFAKGGALGMMGEAGPEAVMPLKRGPDGSLGVQMHGGQQRVLVMVTTDDDRFNAYTDERAEGAVARGAPAIASAGAQVAQKQSAFRNNRRYK